MGRISGHYEWDDDELRPGVKAEGGLHQNLFDEAGQLRGSARFVPGDEPLIVTETVYVPTEDRRTALEDEELRANVTRLANILIAAAIEHGPTAARWLRKRLGTARDARRARRTSRPTSDVSVEIDPPAPVTQVDVREARPAMSSSEAQARYLAALAARVYSDEQLRLIQGADIVGGGDVRQIAASLTRLQSEEVRDLLLAMSRNPSQLEDRGLAGLASALGRQQQRDLQRP